MGLNGTKYIVTIAAASAPRPDKSNKPLSKDLIVPYWLVRPTTDKQTANMQIATMKSTVTIAAGDKESPEEAIMIPIMENFKALKAGDELLVYKGPTHVAAEPLAPAPKAVPASKPVAAPKPPAKRPSGGASHGSSRKIQRKR